MDALDVAEYVTCEPVWTIVDVEVVVLALRLLCCFAMIVIIFVIAKALYRLLRIFF